MPIDPGTAMELGAQAMNHIKGYFDAFSAAKQLKKDKAELAGLTSAFYKVQDEYYGNVNNAAELAQGGLTAGAKDFYGDQAARGLGTGVSATLQAGGSPNDIARIFDGYNSGIRSLAAEDSQSQINNIKYYAQASKDLAAQKTIQWGVNEYQPYQNKLKELTERIAADKINKNNAINSIIGSTSSAGTALSNQSLTDRLFANSGNGETSDPFGTTELSKKASDFNFSSTDQGENYNRPSASFEGIKNSLSSGQGLSEEQLAEIMDMIKQASRPKE